MAKTFKGRVITKGSFVGEAIVSHQGVNTLATFQKSAIMNKKQVIASDQNNPDIYNKNLTGKILCLPMTIGSTTGGMVIQTVCNMGIAPRAFLFSEHIDPLAASGVILAKVWQNSNIIAIDELGKEFLETVKTGDNVEIKEDGSVTIK
jgi:predicted aconitase with swiveling domain